MKLKNLPAFVCLNMLLWSIASLLYFRTNGFFTDALGIVFSSLFIPAHIGLMAVAFGLLCASLYKLSEKHFDWICISLGTIAGFFWAVDIVIFTLYRFHLSLAMVQLFLGPAGREIFVFPLSMWGIILAFTAGLIGLEYALCKISLKISLSFKKTALIFAIWLMLFAGYNALYAWGKFMMVPSIMAQRGVLPYTFPLSANSTLRKLGFEPKKEPFILPDRGNLHYPLAPLSCTLKQPDKNILLILVESWRADTITPEVMPFLTEQKNNETISYFANHISGGNATEAGVFSLFYALPYSYWNDFTSRQLPPFVISHAQEIGYTPAIYSSGKLNSPTFHQNVFASVPNLRLASKGETKWERDVNAVEDFEKFLDTKKTPFFGFIFLDAPHGNSYPPDEKIFTPAEEMNYLLLNQKTDPTPYVNSYKNSLHFTDKLIRRIFDSLKQRNLLDDTVIFITGDHGQEFNDTHHNNWGHNSNFAKYQTHVPLFVWFPNGPLPGTRTHTTSHYDIVPTIVQHIYQCNAPVFNYAIGQDLFDTIPHPFTIISSYTKKAIRTGDKLTILDAYGNVEMYDENYNPIDDGADPAAIKEALHTFSQFYY